MAGLDPAILRDPQAKPADAGGEVIASDGYR